jgi:hypothetical protein
VLVNTIGRTWLRSKVVTLVAFDLKGGYNRVIVIVISFTLTLWDMQTAIATTITTESPCIYTLPKDEIVAPLWPMFAPSGILFVRWKTFPQIYITVNLDE